MTDWSGGYVTDITYTYGYYNELNPLRVRLGFLNAGLVPPEVATACELGFGQGMSINLHAAASSVQWFGTDFNPAHAGFAQDLARVAESGAQLFDEAFEQFCRRADLPDFDYIGLHGIWSWISDENRRVIVDFVRRKLKVGGVLYISYNTQPGWAAMVPMRDLLTEHAAVMGADGAGIVSRIDAALNFAERLLAVNPAYARANPQIAERIKKIKEQNRHYLAHEYFNRDWRPMSVAQMGEWLASAKLTWACSAHYLDAIDAIHLTAEQQRLLADIPDPMFRQLVRDFCVNQQFRKDYWVKGARRLTPLEQAEALRAQRVIRPTTLGCEPKDHRRPWRGRLAGGRLCAHFGTTCRPQIQNPGSAGTSASGRRPQHHLCPAAAGGAGPDRRWGAIACARRCRHPKGQKAHRAAQCLSDDEGALEQ